MSSSAAQREIVVCHDAAALAAEAAKHIIDVAQQSVSQRGRFTLVLSGGSTPEQAYAILAKPDRVKQIDWAHTWLFFGDERCVPPADANSNYRMAARALLEPAHIDTKHVLRIPTDLGNPVQCAKSYESQLRSFFAVHDGGALPQFDLVLLGLGNDGHTASLFPGMPTLHETKAWVTSSRPGILPPPVDRVTLTYPLLNAAREVIFLVSGAAKAPTVREVLEGHSSIEKHPAVGIHPSHGKVTWLLDEAAAKLLTNKPGLKPAAN